MAWTSCTALKLNILKLFHKLDLQEHVCSVHRLFFPLFIVSNCNYLVSFFRTRHVKNLKWYIYICFWNLINIFFHFNSFKKSGRQNFLDLEPGHSNGSKNGVLGNLGTIIGAKLCHASFRGWILAMLMELR